MNFWTFLLLWMEPLSRMICNSHAAYEKSGIFVDDSDGTAALSTGATVKVNGWGALGPSALTKTQGITGMSWAIISRQDVRNLLHNFHAKKRLRPPRPKKQSKYRKSRVGKAWACPPVRRKNVTNWFDGGMTSNGWACRFAPLPTLPAIALYHTSYSFLFPSHSHTIQSIIQWFY